MLLDRYRLEDCATKVVGIGSVGTRCFVALFFSEENHPLILQFKEAPRSVLEPYAGQSVYENQGQRVVVGQRLMQSSSDIFLGWVRGRGGRDFYVRQLRDMKLSIPVESLTAQQLERYAEICGWSLARAHAKSGDAATISGYLGKGDTLRRRDRHRSRSPTPTRPSATTPRSRRRCAPAESRRGRRTGRGSRGRPPGRSACSRAE